MVAIPEKNLTFEFPDEWQVIKYDDSNFYRKRFEQMDDVKGLDFLARTDAVLWMIEARDFRGYRIQNKKRMQNNELTLEVAKKVRDTVAVLYDAHRFENQELRSFHSFLFGRNDPTARLEVILLLEEDRPQSGHKQFKAVRSNLVKALKQRLRFLSIRVSVHNRDDLPDDYGWSVT